MGKRLTKLQRESMYQWYMSGDFTVRQLAEKYGVVEQTASNIIGELLPAKARVSKPEKVKLEPLPKSKYRSRGGLVDPPKDNIRMDEQRIPKVELKTIDY